VSLKNFKACPSDFGYLSALERSQGEACPPPVKREELEGGDFFSPLSPPRASRAGGSWLPVRP